MFRVFTHVFFFSSQLTSCGRKAKRSYPRDYDLWINRPEGELNQKKRTAFGMGWRKQGVCSRVAMSGEVEDKKKKRYARSFQSWNNSRELLDREREKIELTQNHFTFSSHAAGAVAAPFDHFHFVNLKNRNMNSFSTCFRLNGSQHRVHWQGARFAV